MVSTNHAYDMAMLVLDAFENGKACAFGPNPTDGEILALESMDELTGNDAAYIVAAWREGMRYEQLIAFAETQARAAGRGGFRNRDDVVADEVEHILGGSWSARVFPRDVARLRTAWDAGRDAVNGTVYATGA